MSEVRERLDRTLTQLPPEPHAAIVGEFALQGGHVGPSEKESPWVPFGDSAAIRHLAFDVRIGAVADVLWVKGGGRIGTHRQRGPVFWFIDHYVSHCRAHDLPINRALFL